MRSMILKGILISLVLTTVSAVGQTVSVEKYTLPNGMTVILHEDHSLPVAAVNLWYRVGSKDEQPGRSGFAHLFEHLMFMGTARVPGNAFDVLMESGGGWNNASTSEDRTNYYSFGPSSLLPTLLWLDADRLEALGENMTLEKLDKQREVVRNERRQTSENTPYGRAELRIPEMMFPAGHPYHHTVIGSHEDLQAATVNDVKNFFATYYVPCNASLVVAGDFDPATIKPLIAQLFGTLPRGSEPVHMSAAPVKLDRVKRTTMSDDVEFPRVWMVYHSPKHYADGDAEMDLLARVLSNGITSRLYQRLMYGDNKLAVDVSAYQQSMLLGSIFHVIVDAPPEADLAAVEKAVDDVLAELREKGPSKEELEREKASLEHEMLDGMQPVLERADMLNQYEFAFGEPDGFKRDLDRYRNATAEGVRNWARQVLTPDARLILHVLPELPAPPSDPRATAPKTASSDKVTLPEPAAFTLSNGLKVQHWERKALPLTCVSLVFNGGASLDTFETCGLASVTADMLSAGAGSRGALEFEEALKAIGADFSASVDREWSSVDLQILTRNLDPALGLMADAVMRPAFDAKEWKRVKRDAVNDLKSERDDPASVAGAVGLRVFFGDAHPYGRPVDGTPEAVQKLELDQVKAFHARAYSPRRAVLLTAGDLSPEQMKAKLEPVFGSWTGPEAGEESTWPGAPEGVMRVVLVHRPGAVQTVVRFFAPGPAYDAPQRIALEAFGTILGGSFTSRLNQNLREDKGYTYGARCAYVFGRRAGFFQAGASVHAEVTGASLKEFFAEFDRIRGGDISEDEAAKAKAQVRTDVLEGIESLSGLLTFAGELAHLDRPFSSLAEDLTALNTVPASRLNELARPAVALEKCVLVLVGDRDVILGQIADLKLPAPIELDEAGNPAERDRGPAVGASRESAPRP